MTTTKRPVGFEKFDRRPAQAPAAEPASQRGERHERKRVSHQGVSRDGRRGPEKDDDLRARPAGRSGRGSQRLRVTRRRASVKKEKRRQRRRGDGEGEAEG